MLKCGHTVCEKCFMNGCRNNSYSCKVCRETFTLQSYESRHIYEQAEMNYYLFGCLTFMNYDLKYYTNFNEKKNNAVKTDFVKEIEDNDVLCHECTDKKTSHFCVQCTVPLCEACFNKLHMNSKTFRTHQLGSMSKLIIFIL